MMKRAYLILTLACLPLVCLPLVAHAGPGDAPRKRSHETVRAVKRPADPSTLCESAASAAEREEGLPPRLLQAIGLTESGRLDPATGKLRPWPWTIDVEGDGQFFATRDEAIAAVRSAQARGVRSIDVGCDQVNLMHHPAAFASLEEAFDPAANARYAAHFLNALHAESRDWSRAIAAYHSETPALGDAYRELVLARWRNPDLREAVAQGGAYQDFAPRSQTYGAFQSADKVYGAFSQSQ